MAEPLHPLLPFALALGLAGLLGLELVREVGWEALTAKEAHDPTLGTLGALPTRRADGDALLLLGNSRAGFAMQEPRTLPQVTTAAGMDAQAYLVFGPELAASTLAKEQWKLVAWHPTVVVMQIDLLLPLGPKGRYADPVGRLMSYQRRGPEAEAGLTLLGRLWWARRVVLEVPMGRTLAMRLGDAWWVERRQIHAALRARGLEVIADEQPWPDALFLDGLHFSVEGAFAFRRWLGQRLGGG